MRFYHERGANIFTLSTEVRHDYEKIEQLGKIAVELGMRTEMLVNGTACYTGIGCCTLFYFFKQGFKEIVLMDSDGFGGRKIWGNPETGGGCYRPCLYLEDPLVQSVIPEKVLVELEKEENLNERFTFAANIPSLIDIGVDIFKIQGEGISNRINQRFGQLYEAYNTIRTSVSVSL